MYNGSMQMFIPSLLNLFCCLLIRSAVTFHMIPAMGGRGLQNNERGIFPLKSILRWQIYFEAALKPVKMFCRSDFSCGQVSCVQPWSPPGSLCGNCQRQLGVAAETCVCAFLCQVLCQHTVTGSLVLPVMSGAVPPAVVAAHLQGRCPSSPLDLLHLAQAGLGC